MSARVAETAARAIRLTDSRYFKIDPLSGQRHEFYSRTRFAALLTQLHVYGTATYFPLCPTHL
jgi:hypothetical protein